MAMAIGPIFFNAWMNQASLRQTLVESSYCHIPTNQDGDAENWADAHYSAVELVYLQENKTCNKILLLGSNRN